MKQAKKLKVFGLMNNYVTFTLPYSTGLLFMNKWKQNMRR